MKRFVRQHPAKQRLEGWQRCIMPVVSNKLTARIDEKSGNMFGIHRKGERCKVLVPPDKVAMLGAAVCQMHTQHYVASLQSSVAHKRERLAKLDPGCAIE